KSRLAVNLERHAFTATSEVTIFGPAPNEQETSPSGARSLAEGTSCPDSLDVSITEGLPNDFPALFAKYPRSMHVFFNGSRAEAAFSPSRAACVAGRPSRLRAPCIDQPRPCRDGSLLTPGVGQLPEPDITSPNSFQVVPSNRSNCICLIGA